MTVLNPISLSSTLNSIQNRISFNNPLTKNEKNEISLWIAQRQGQAGSYGGMFAPTKLDFEGICVYTGESVTSKAGISHILGEESLRALRIIDSGNSFVKEKLKLAENNMLSYLDRSEEKGGNSGAFCCGKCTVSLWRNILVGGYSRHTERLSAGMDFLKENRDGKGRWRTFPFYYTLLALNEMDSELIENELTYISPSVKRIAARKPKAQRDIIRHQILTEIQKKII